MDDMKTGGWVYILQCIDKSYYTGSTRILKQRIWQHKNGLGASYTKKRLPIRLVFAQHFDRIDEAFNMEKQIQGWSRAKKKALIQGRLEDLPQLSKSKGS